MDTLIREFEIPILWIRDTLTWRFRPNARLTRGRRYVMLKRAE
jgi:hypothetical protein